MNVCESLTVNAVLFPERVALIFQGQQITYRQLDDLSAAAAEVLSSRGVEIGDRVAIQIGNCPAFPVWYYATLRLGAIAVSISTRLSDSERQYIIDHSGSRVLVSDGKTGEEVPASELCIRVSTDGKSCDDVELAGDAEPGQWHDADPNDPALILYTSGTTGFPKGATLSHGNVRSNVAAFNHLCQMKTTDSVLLAVPLFHCFGQNALLNSVLNVGATLVLQERFDLAESKQLIRNHQVNQLYGVPMMFQLLLDYCSKENLESVDYCFSAAAPLAIQVAIDWEKKFSLPIYEGYGLTETSPFASYNHRNRFVAGSIGMPIDSVEMKIVDPETGEQREPDQLGEIAIRGPNVMLGYWNQPEETEKAIRDGWFLSGDIGKQNRDGYFFIVDRVKDMIAVGGMKVFPAEVERVLRDSEVVGDAAVVGVEESVLGEQVIGFVVLQSAEKANMQTILDDAKRNLADYKVPRRIFEIEELPRNPSGKVLKTKLRELARELLSAPATGNEVPAEDSAKENATDGGSELTDQEPINEPSAPVPSATSTSQRILEPGLIARINQVHPTQKKEIAAAALAELVVALTGNQETPDYDRTFLEAGMDSLMLVELGTQLQLELQSAEPLSATLIFDYPRISDLSGFILESLDQKSDGSNEIGMSIGNDTENQEVAESQDQNLMEEIRELSEEEALEQLMKELE